MKAKKQTTKRRVRVVFDSPEEKAEMIRAAARAGMSLSKWVEAALSCAFMESKKATA